MVGIPGAIMPLPELQEIIRRNSSKRADDSINCLPVVALSYCWFTAKHPDPHGQQLKLFAEKLKEEFTDPFRRVYEDNFSDVGTL